MSPPELIFGDVIITERLLSTVRYSNIMKVYCDERDSATSVCLNKSLDFSER